MPTEDLKHRFTYHAPNAVKVALHEAVRFDLGELAEYLDQALPAGREKAVAITKLEEVMFWAHAAIARSTGLPAPSEEGR